MEKSWIEQTLERERQEKINHARFMFAEYQKTGNASAAAWWSARLEEMEGGKK